ncbi:hypothetical protein [Micromonospora schwarzwaldensis]|uniref:hypothetical protein n=1 Tax=Micromonospora sp. DSM 45708 TaxID=3111767 RepID=UPI0031D70903
MAMPAVRVSRGVRLPIAVAPEARLLPRGYWQEQPLAERLHVSVPVDGDAVTTVLDGLARRSDTFVQDAERPAS